MKPSYYKYIFDELNLFGALNGSYHVSTDQNDIGIFVSAYAKDSNLKRWIIVRRSNEKL